MLLKKKLRYPKKKATESGEGTATVTKQKMTLTFAALLPAVCLHRDRVRHLLDTLSPPGDRSAGPTVKVANKNPRTTPEHDTALELLTSLRGTPCTVSALIYTSHSLRWDVVDRRREEHRLTQGAVDRARHGVRRVELRLSPREHVAPAPPVVGANFQQLCFFGRREHRFVCVVGGTCVVCHVPTW